MQMPPVPDTPMADVNRLRRVHVATVRARDNKFYVILSDRSEVPWDVWVTMTQDERWNQ